MELVKNLIETKKDIAFDAIEALRQSVIKSDADIHPNNYILKIENTNKFSKGNISTFTGLAKSKKTFALTMIASALSSGKSVGNKFNPNCKSVVNYVDTEQSPYDAQVVLRRVDKIAGSKDAVRMFALRPFTPKQRVEIIETILKLYSCDVLIIDGIRDLLMDINNAVESTEIVTKVMKWSYDYDIHIANVIHQNQSDGKVRGHIGTEIQNKAETIIRITKDEQDRNRSWVEEVYGRGKGFDKFAFEINENGIPVIIDTITNVTNFNEDDTPF